jgi:hypothetical protein
VILFDDLRSDQDHRVMNEDFAIPNGPVQVEQRQDARDLLARLYREIGIAAVAAALSVNIREEHDEDNVLAVVDLIAKKDIAA